MRYAPGYRHTLDQRDRPDARHVGRPLDRLSGGDRDHHDPPNEPPRHGWAELLTLVGDLRRLAYDSSLDDADRARRIRDRLGVYDSTIDDGRS